MGIYLDYLGGLLRVSNSREYNNLPSERSHQFKIDIFNLRAGYLLFLIFSATM